MAITFVGSASNGASPNASVSVDLSGISLAENDLVIAGFTTGDNDNVDNDLAPTTTGYTEVADLFSNDAGDNELYVGWKFMGGTPDSTFDFPALNGTDAANAAVVMAFRGVKLVADGGPLDTTSATTTGLDTMHPNPPEIDHSGAAGVWTVIVGSSVHQNGAAVTYTFPTGYTTNPVQISHNDTTDCSIGMGYNSSPSDPENPGVMTLSGTDNTGFCWCAVTMALSPVAEAAPASLLWTPPRYHLITR